MIKARIVITAFNNDSDLIKCIACLHAQTLKDFEVVIVNNGSEPITLSKTWGTSGWLTLIESDENIGFAGGSNLGAAGAKTEWIVTLNPDAWPHKDWFHKLMSEAGKAPKHDMLSSTLINAENSKILDGTGDYYSILGLTGRTGYGTELSKMEQAHSQVLSPCGAAAAYRRTVFEENGGFDSAYFCYLEDVDLGLRLQSKGHTCRHVYNAYVEHVGGGSTAMNSEFQLYHTHKNQLRLMCKLSPMPVLIVQMPLYLLIQLYLLIRTIRSPNWTAKVRGLRHGLGLSPRVLLKERPNAQKQRHISSLQYAKLLSWSLKEIRRKYESR